MIRRVRIQGYKSLQDIDIELAPLTIVIGPNAAGKSNLLDALGLLSRMATSSHRATEAQRRRDLARLRKKAFVLSVSVPRSGVFQESPNRNSRGGSRRPARPCPA